MKMNSIQFLSKYDLKYKILLKAFLRDIRPALKFAV